MEDLSGWDQRLTEAPHDLHAFQTSKDKRGIDSLEETYFRVTVLPHGIPRNPDEVELIDPSFIRRFIPFAALGKFTESLPEAGKIKGGPLKDDLLYQMRSQSAGTLVIVPGHTEFGVSSDYTISRQLVLRDGTRVSLQEVIEAARKGVVILLMGCETTEVKVTGEAVIGVNGQFWWRSIIGQIKKLREMVPKRPLKEVLYNIQKNGLGDERYVPLVMRAVKDWAEVPWAWSAQNNNHRVS